MKPLCESNIMMDDDRVPNTEIRRSESTSTSREHAPTTPKLPFDPPRRRSSLAFSRIIDPPATNETCNSGLERESSMKNLDSSLRSNIGRKRTTGIPLRRSELVSEQLADVQRILQTARANLHLDMHFAASPIGSIDSRLPQESRCLADEQGRNMVSTDSDPAWRYSTVPKLFSSAILDVREPLSCVSPALPAVSMQISDSNDHFPMEPTSSGFASPASAERASVNNGDAVDLPPLPSSSPPHVTVGNGDVIDSICTSNDETEDLADLTVPMTELRVESGINRCNEGPFDEMDNSPILDHLQRRLGGNGDFFINMPDLTDGIFLSRSAKAAAESAKAKRGLLQQTFSISACKEGTTFTDRCPNPMMHSGTTSGCPDPGIHDYAMRTPCPDFTAHFQLNNTRPLPDSSGTMRAPSHNETSRHFPPRGPFARTQALTTVGQRTTATGSPMPLSRRTFSPVMDTAYRSRFVSSPPPQLSKAKLSPGVFLVPQHAQKPSEHFRPGWYYAGSSERQKIPSTNLYSFSTAAAKITGESVAPDSRIRDSYRTDTLTPLARPPGRFKKNGIAATLNPSGSRRLRHGSGLPRRIGSRRVAASDWQVGPSRLRDTRIQSSPPRSFSKYASVPNTRKRDVNGTVMPEFELAEDGSAASTRTSIRFRPEDEVMKVDAKTRDAIRMSLFGPGTLESSREEQDGMRELSPNVKVWRKGMPVGPQYRKKRRPSYWDDDLEEVRMSPAGRGGIESSPTMSKRSMVAELEHMSRTSNTHVTDENAVLTSDIGGVWEQAINEQEVDMADAAEVEA